MTNTAKPTPKNIGLNDFWDKFQNEAWESYRMTGLTPRQLLEQRDELRDLICSARTFEIAQAVGEQAMQLLDYLRGAVDDLFALAKHGEGV